MRIYTRGGDKGKTGIHGGERVDKDDIRIEANGTLDELNAEIGIVRTLLPPDHEWQVLLGRIQREMMAVMSHVATPSAIRDKNPNPLPDDLAVFCESHIDDLSAQMEDNGYFILPGRHTCFGAPPIGPYDHPQGRTPLVDIESERPGSCRDHGVRESFIGSVLYDGTL